jgi:hypothetical protein
VVEKVHHRGAEVVGVERPAAPGKGDAELVFLIALAVQSSRTSNARAVTRCIEESNFELPSKFQGRSSKENIPIR